MSIWWKKRGRGYFSFNRAYVTEDDPPYNYVSVWYQIVLYRLVIDIDIPYTKTKLPKVREES